MNKDVDSRRFSRVSEPHIQILKRENNQHDVSGMNTVGVTRPSLARELSLTHSVTISNMEKGTTFAARARAVELNSIRAAAKAANKNAIEVDEEEDEVPAVLPVSLGSLKLTLPKRKDLSKTSSSHGQADGPVTLSKHSEDTNLQYNSTDRFESITSGTRQSLEPSQAPQSATLNKRASTLDQQAIRQKVREVSARQQSLHNASKEDKHATVATVLPGSGTVSPYSSSEGRIGLAQLPKKAELNTQHIREIRREAEKQRDLAQSRAQNHLPLDPNNTLNENQRLGPSQPVSPSSHSYDKDQGQPQQLLPTLDRWDVDMSIRGKGPFGPPSSYHSPRSDYESSIQASLRFGGSPVPTGRQKSHATTNYYRYPSATMAESTMDSQYRSSLMDATRSSSTYTPMPSEYLAPAQLRATSPAFVPFNAGSVSRHGQPKIVLPSVKGTKGGQISSQPNQFPHGAQGTGGRDKGAYEPAASGSSAQRAGHQPLDTLPEDMDDVQRALQGSTSSTLRAAGLHDSMPYTGFSKKDQLYEQLQKTINETAAKGNRPASNRSVLFDPVASATTATSMFDRSSNGGTSITMNSSNMDSRGQKAQIPPFVFPQPPPPTPPAEPDYDPDYLKDSDPLPPFGGSKPIETKFLSSPEEGYGYQSDAAQSSATTPRFPPGLKSQTTPLQETQISNHDGFWNDSLAVASGRDAIEDTVEWLATQPNRHGVEQPPWRPPPTEAGLWFQEQQRLLRPKGSPNVAELEQAARKWFDSGRSILEDKVRASLRRSEGVSTSGPATRYWDGDQPEHVRTLSGSRHAPIGSERPRNLTRHQEDRKRGAIDVMSNVLSNLASYHAGSNPGPSQRYSQPPAWCIDHSDAGHKSFFNDNWGDVPKRVGRDPRYQKTVHEGRTTYFEDPNTAGRRDLPGYKATPGWGSTR